MKTLNIPTPPNPETPQYRSNPLAWQRAAADWMQKAKGVIEAAHNEAIRPCGQQFLATSFTTNTVATNTYTAVADVANVLASLIQTLTQKGILSPTVSRGQSQ